MRQLVDAISEVNSHRLQNMSDENLLEGIRLASFNLTLRIPMDFTTEVLIGTVLWEMAERYERNMVKGN